MSFEETFDIVDSPPAASPVPPVPAPTPTFIAGDLGIFTDPPNVAPYAQNNLPTPNNAVLDPIDPMPAPVKAPVTGATTTTAPSEPPVYPPIDTELTRPYAHFGGCWDGIAGSDIVCSTNPQSCSGTLPPYVSGIRIDELVSPVDQCHADDVPAQRCSGAGTLGTCSMGGCGGGATTTKDDKANCDLVKDKSNNVATLYGGCQEIFSKDFIGCYWSEADCHHYDTSQETWMTPDHLIAFLSIEGNQMYFPKGYCDCSDVRIGACRTNDGLLCAVDASQCGPNEAFISARTIRDNSSVYGTLDCRLCESNEITPQISSATDKFLKTKLNDLVDSSSDSSLEEEIGNPSTKPWEPNEAGLIAGAVIGGIIGLLIIICLGTCIYRKCNGIEETSKMTTFKVDDEEQGGGGGGGGGGEKTERDVTESPDDVPAVQNGVVS